jgi:hypothetical protein
MVLDGYDIRELPDNCSPKINPNEVCVKTQSKIVDCDREAWIKDRLKTCIRTSIAIYKEKQVCADNDLINSAMEGLINGTAVEIIQQLGMQPSYINLRKVKHDFINNIIKR